MSTVNELIDKVCEMYSRPDLPARLLSNFKSALYNAHRIDKFARDKSIIYLANPAILDGAVSFSLITELPRLREITKVQLYSSYTLNGSTVVPGTEILVADPGFQNLANLVSEKNYYGFRYTALYSILGNNVNFTGVDTTTTAMGITAFFNPTYEYNEVDDIWETDSWILRDEPQVVEAYLRKHVAQILDDDKKMRNANDEINQVRRDLIAAYVTELS